MNYIIIGYMDRVCSVYPYDITYKSMIEVPIAKVSTWYISSE